MNLKYNREEITWVDKKYLSKEIAKDLAGFWVNTTNKKLYCARQTEVGVAHYYFNAEESEWKLDSFCGSNNNFREDTGIVFDLKSFETEIIDNVLYIIEDGMFKMKLSIEDTILYCEQLEIDIEDVCFQYLPIYVKAKKPLIAYKGNFKFIVFELDFIKEYIRFSNSL